MNSANDPSVPGVIDDHHSDEVATTQTIITSHHSIKGSVSVKSTALYRDSCSDELKEKLRRGKTKPVPYNVHDMYHEKGTIQFIAKHPLFENTTLGIIVINALWIWIDTDYNHAETIDQADAGFVLMDSLFFIYFSIEVAIRFLAFERKANCCKDGWFVFDCTLVCLYGFDPFLIGIIARASGGGGLDLPTAVLRLFRLARLSRLVRMLRSMPELMIMIKGMVSALGTVGYTLGLLLMINYIFSIALVNLRADDSPLSQVYEEGPPSDQDDPGYFSTVPNSILALLVYGTFLDNLADFIYAVKNDDNVLLFILTWLYICAAAITVMNMLIGVLCAVIDSVAENEQENMLVDMVTDKFVVVLEAMDKNKDGFLSWVEFQGIVESEVALGALDDLKIDPESLIDLAEDLFFEDGEMVLVSFDEFMQMILDLRGGQIATVKDIYSMGKRFHQKHIRVTQQLDTVERALESINHLVSEKFLS